MIVATKAKASITQRLRDMIGFLTEACPAAPYARSIWAAGFIASIHLLCGMLKLIYHRFRSRQLHSASSAERATRIRISGDQFRRPWDLASLAELPCHRLSPSARTLLVPDSQSASSVLIQDGKTLYGSNGSGCHGADTLGTDYAPKLIGKPDVHRRTVDQLRILIKCGIPTGGMPAFGTRCFGPPFPEISADRITTK